MPPASKNARWWDEKKNDVHGTLGRVFASVRDESAWQLDADEYHAELYSGCSGASGVRSRSMRSSAYGPSTLPYNVCRNATQTVVAKIAKHRPMPQVLANRGSWTSQKRSRKMSQFIEGCFYNAKIFEKHAKTIVRDACIFGRGILRVFTERKKVKAERVHPWELFRDQWDGRYGCARNLYHLRTVDRGVAMAEYASGSRKLKDAIEFAGRFTTSTTSTANDPDESNTVSRVEVLEAWHLCDGHDDEEDHKCTGRHVVIVQGATLIDEPWEYDFFPFAELNFDDPLVGTVGVGLIEELEGFQYEINHMSEKVSEAHRFLGCSLIMVPDGAGIHDQELRNGIAMLLHHKPGGKPDVFSPPPVHPQTYQRLKELPLDALNDVGVSQMSAMSQIPAGMAGASGVALQTMDDVETERFIVFGRSYEAWCLDVARLFIWGAKQVAEEYGEFAVAVPMKGGLLDLKWADVEIDGYELRVFPTSLLPQQLGARLEKLKTLFEANLIDRATFMRQLDAPDLAAELDMETADKLLVDETLEYMRDVDEDAGEAGYKPPNPYIDLNWAARRAQQKLNRCDIDGAPEYVLEYYRRYIGDCEELMKKIAGPPANDASTMGAVDAANAAPMPADASLPIDTSFGNLPMAPDATLPPLNPTPPMPAAA